MIVEFVLSFIAINVVFELIEIVFPSERMGVFVRSFSLLVLLYAVISIFL